MHVSHTTCSECKHICMYIHKMQLEQAQAQIERMEKNLQNAERSKESGLAAEQEKSAAALAECSKLRNELREKEAEVSRLDFTRDQAQQRTANVELLFQDAKTQLQTQQKELEGTRKEMRALSEETHRSRILVEELEKALAGKDAQIEAQIKVLRSEKEELHKVAYSLREERRTTRSELLKQKSGLQRCYQRGGRRQQGRQQRRTPYLDAGKGARKERDRSRCPRKAGAGATRCEGAEAARTYFRDAPRSGLTSDFQHAHRRHPHCRHGCAGLFWNGRRHFVCATDVWGRGGGWRSPRGDERVNRVCILCCMPVQVLPLPVRCELRTGSKTARKLHAHQF
jgi:hypothetical protein